MFLLKHGNTSLTIHSCPLFLPSVTSPCFGFRSRTWQANIPGSGWNNWSPKGWSERSCSSPVWVWGGSEDDHWRCPGNSCGHRYQTLLLSWGSGVRLSHQSSGSSLNNPLYHCFCVGSRGFKGHWVFAFPLKQTLKGVWSSYELWAKFQ